MIMNKNNNEYAQLFKGYLIMNTF